MRKSERREIGRRGNDDKRGKGTKSKRAGGRGVNPRPVSAVGEGKGMYF